METFDEKVKRAADAMQLRRGNRNAAGQSGAGESLTLIEAQRMVSQSVAAAKLRIEEDMRKLMTEQIETALASVRRTELVVKLQDKPQKTVTGTVHYLFGTLVKAAALREPIFLSGPAGSGKSTAGKMLADLLDLPFSYTGQTNMPHKVEGSRDPLDHKFYRHTSFTNTFINGGVHMLEEIDAWNPNASLVINPPLANRWLTTEDGAQYEQHPDAVFIACANTWGTGATADYVGRNKLDAAFLDRFGVRIAWGYDYALEREACGNSDVAHAVQLARSNADRYGIKIIISPRSSIVIAKMVAAGFTMKEAFELNFLASCGPDVKKKLMEGVDI